MNETKHRPGQFVKSTKPVPEVPFCACGCGLKVNPPTERHRYRMPTFRKGHSRRGKGWAETLPANVPLGFCECGCGRKTPIVRKSYPELRLFKGHPRPYIPGHRGRLSAEIKHLSPTEAAYIAGIVDGEGTIHFAKTGRYIRVTVANTDFGLLAWLTSTCGGTVQRNHAPALKTNGIEYRKLCGTWVVGSWQSVRELLTQIAPFMLVKKEKAERALELIQEWHLTPRDPESPRRRRTRT